MILFPVMREEYLRAACKVINDPNILVNVVSVRVKQLRLGSRALVESLERLSLPEIALREIAEGRIAYELALPTALGAPASSHPRPISHATRARNVVDLYSSHA